MFCPARPRGKGHGGPTRAWRSEGKASSQSVARQRSASAGQSSWRRRGGLKADLKIWNRTVRRSFFHLLSALRQACPSERVWLSSLILALKIGAFALTVFLNWFGTFSHIRIEILKSSCSIVTSSCHLCR